MTSERLATSEIDERVIRARHSREAFGALFDGYYPRILRYCCLRLGDRHHAEDATSEIFLQVAKSIRAFRGATDVDFRRWLFRIASNVVNAQFRRDHVRRETEYVTEVADGSQTPINSEEEFCSVTRAMQMLDERSQHLIAMRFLEEHSYEEIAEGLEMTPGAVRTAVSRALSELRRLLGVKGFASEREESPRSEPVP